MSATNKKSGWCCNLSPCNLKLKKHLKCDHHFELENFQCSWSNLTWLCSYLKYESIGINRKQAQSPQKHSAGIFTEPPKWWARTKFSNFQTSRIFKIQFHIIFELIWIEWTISIFFFLNGKKLTLKFGKKLSFVLYANDFVVFFKQGHPNMDFSTRLKSCFYIFCTLDVNLSEAKIIQPWFRV